MLYEVLEGIKVSPILKPFCSCFGHNFVLVTKFLWTQNVLGPKINLILRLLYHSRLSLTYKKYWADTTRDKPHLAIISTEICWCIHWKTNLAPHLICQELQDTSHKKMSNIEGAAQDLLALTHSIIQNIRVKNKSRWDIALFVTLYNLEVKMFTFFHPEL